MTESPKSTGVSRRKFMALAGGAAGFAAMAAMGISARQGECSANIPEIDIGEGDGGRKRNRHAGCGKRHCGTFRRGERP